MPYPIDNPTNKHDLQIPPFPLICFPTIQSLFDSLETEVPSNLAPAVPIYSYRDTPSQPLSRSLSVIGVAHAYESDIGKMLLDDSAIPSCLHRCTVAVKRADSGHARALKIQELSNSKAFATFLRRLQQEKAVAILAQDKYHRFGIVAPTDDMTLEGEFEAQDFSAICYIGEANSVRKYLNNYIAISKRPISSVTTSAPEEDEVWKPTDVNTGYWQPPVKSSESTFSIPASENIWQPIDQDKSNGDRAISSTFHADAGAAAADLFYSGLTRTLDTRAESRLYHMRAFNGWVKATQIQELDPKTSKKKVGAPLRVLDLACGKGGDLGKWVLHSRGIHNYVGIDVARGSLVDAAIRARKMGQKLKLCTFTCADLGSDVPGRLKSPRHKHLQKLSTWSLDHKKTQAKDDPEFKLLRGGGISQDEKFDVVSIQFAIHYMMETKKRALRFFQTVSELLDIGGNLIVTTIDARVIVHRLMNMGLNLHFDDNTVVHEPVVIVAGAGACRIKFEPDIVKQIFTTKWNDDEDIHENLFGLRYSFTLVEGSDHASGIGEAVDLPEWLIPIPVLSALGQQAGLEIDYAQNFHEFYDSRSDPSVHAAAHTSLYNMNVLNRNGSISEDEFEISGLYIALKFRKVRESNIRIDDYDEGESSDSDTLDNIDPTVKSKLFPMALMKAKQVVGSDSWTALTSDEKKRLTELELKKLLPK
jgi:SAM-dependent methyltransferase